jgi:hypothetical protein
MSNTEEIQTSKIHQSWLACRRAHDAATANMILTQHGSRDASIAGVPKNRVDDCIAALQRLAGKPKDGHAKDDGGTGLERVRKQAFSRMGSPETQHAPSPTTLDSAEIYQRWNNPPPVGD